MTSSNMSFVESQAVLESRIGAVGLDETIKKLLLDGGVKNLATLAFIIVITILDRRQRSL